MSRTTEELKTVRKVVVFFDICDSTIILEDLLRTESQRQWRNLLIKLKKFLGEEESKAGFEIYKFIGDGWILLFDENTEGIELMKFLERLDTEYAFNFHNGVCAVLETVDHEIGLTFGIDCGTLVRIVMNQQVEYVGRPLNVAARLQGAVGTVAKVRKGKALLSKKAHVTLSLSSSKKYKGKVANPKLRNLSGGNTYQARLIDLSK
jgi:class 3 adenylate cyclase